MSDDVLSRQIKYVGTWVYELQSESFRRGYFAGFEAAREMALHHLPQCNCGRAFVQPGKTIHIKGNCTLCDCYHEARETIRALRPPADKQCNCGEDEPQCGECER